jgi:hypothetical protein
MTRRAQAGLTEFQKYEFRIVSRVFHDEHTQTRHGLQRAEFFECV